MSAIQVIFVLAFSTLCSAVNYKPVFFPGPCPSIPSTPKFDESSVLNTYYGTYYSNPSFHGFHCLTNQITKNANGIQLNARFFNESGHEFNYTYELRSTSNPGVYDTSFKLPHNENVTIASKEVVFAYKNRILIWGCVDDLKNNQHAECAWLFSTTPNTPSTTVAMVKRYIKAHGSSLENFYPVSNNDCKN